MDNLPPSKCSLGYTQDELSSILGQAELRRFNRWMEGQTGGICTGRSYNYDTQEYHASGCGPHGYVVYGHDLKRFLLRLPVMD